MVLRWLLGWALMVALIIAAILAQSSLQIFLNSNTVMIDLGIVCGGVLWAFPVAQIALVLREYVTQGELSEERARVGHAVFSRAADSAMAAGLVGPLLGAVQMWAAVNGPAPWLGPAMSVALLNLLYAVILSELVFRSAASDCLSRAKITGETYSRRGFGSVYAAMAMLFLMLFFLFLMLFVVAPR